MPDLDSDSLQRFLEQYTSTFTPELARHFSKLPPSDELQKRLDELGEKSNEGTLTEEERIGIRHVRRGDGCARLAASSFARR